MAHAWFSRDVRERASSAISVLTTASFGRLLDTSFGRSMKLMLCVNEETKSVSVFAIG